MSLSGPTVFAASTPEDNVLALQLFLTGLAIPVLLLGAYVDGVNRAAHRSRALSQMVLRSTEENHRKIAGDLHEGVCQDLAAVCLRARHLFKGLPPQARDEAAAIEEDILQVIRTLRTAAYGMYPPLLAEGGLEPALRSFVGAYSERTGIAVSLHLPNGIGRLPPSSESVAFRIVQEALTNVERHSRSATARVTLCSSGNSDNGLLLRIEDPAPSAPRRKSALCWLKRLAPSSLAGGLGIAAMTERINAIGGRLHVQSAGGSTVVEAAFRGAPLERSDSSAAMARQACS
jgi:two-component system NarL family sensor kinase